MCNLNLKEISTRTFVMLNVPHFGLYQLLLTCRLNNLCIAFVMWFCIYFPHRIIEQRSCSQRRRNWREGSWSGREDHQFSKSGRCWPGSGISLTKVPPLRLSSHAVQNRSVLADRVCLFWKPGCKNSQQQNRRTADSCSDSRSRKLWNRSAGICRRPHPGMESGKSKRSFQTF